MGAPVFIGDEAVAAGFRLCGLRTVVPAPGEELSALELARADAPLVLVKYLYGNNRIVKRVKIRIIADRVKG